MTPTCIDCSSTDKTVLVTQERRVSGRLCTWQICPSCLASYQRVTQEIAREREAKVLGRTSKSKTTKPVESDAQGVL